MINNYWKLKNTKTKESIDLDQDMLWIDEFGWSPVAQSNPVVLLGGDQDVQQGLRTSGRPISLHGEWVWFTRGDIEKLQQWAETPELKLKLTHYNGSEFDVIFRLHEQALKATPVNYQTPESNEDPYTLELNLMEI